jgi:hypothetical protein
MVRTLALRSCQAESATIGLDFTLTVRLKGASTAAFSGLGGLSYDLPAWAVICMNLFHWANPIFNITYTTS